jgi:hypothetical protein
MAEEFFPYGAQPGSPMDNVALLLNGLAKRCTTCRRPTMLKWLEDGLCPVCRKVADQTPGHRSYGSNAGRECDTNSGPCSCGAWH